MHGNKIRICVIGPRDILIAPGGIEIHCTYLYRAIAGINTRYRIIILASYVNEIGRRVSHSGALITIRVKSLPYRYLEKFSYSFKALACIVRLKPDIIHAHGMSVAWVIPLLRVLGYKVVFTQHSTEFSNPGVSPIKRLVSKFAVYFTRMSNNVIAVSRAAGSGFSECEIIPNGLSVDYPHESLIKATNILNKSCVEDGKYILYVGRVVPEKGVDLLFQAISNISTLLPVVILGKYHQSCPYIETLTNSMKNANRFVFLGPVEHMTTLAIMSRAALYVNPSYSEGYSIAPREAVALGVPVLLSDIEPHRSILLPEFCYFKSGDALDLASKINNLLSVDDSDLHKYANPSVGVMWEEVAQRTLQIYKNLLA